MLIYFIHVMNKLNKNPICLPCRHEQNFHKNCCYATQRKKKEQKTLQQLQNNLFNAFNYTHTYIPTYMENLSIT